MIKRDINSYDYSVDIESRLFPSSTSKQKYWLDKKSLLTNVSSQMRRQSLPEIRDILNSISFKQFDHTNTC